MQGNFRTSLGTGSGAMSELVVLQALGQIYAGAHRAETRTIKETGADGTASIEVVWASFDKQVAMLGVLLGSPATCARLLGRDRWGEACHRSARESGRSCSATAFTTCRYGGRGRWQPHVFLQKNSLNGPFGFAVLIFHRNLVWFWLPRRLAGKSFLTFS